MKTLYVAVLLLTNAALYAQPGQSEFQPVTEVPASEQMPCRGWSTSRRAATTST